MRSTSIIYTLWYSDKARRGRGGADEVCRNGRYLR